MYALLAGNLFQAVEIEYADLFSQKIVPKLPNKAI
jgi:hypothetical protein